MSIHYKNYMTQNVSFYFVLLKKKFRAVLGQQAYNNMEEKRIKFGLKSKICFQKNK